MQRKYYACHMLQWLRLSTTLSKLKYKVQGQCRHLAAHYPYSFWEPCQISNLFGNRYHKQELHFQLCTQDVGIAFWNMCEVKWWGKGTLNTNTGGKEVESQVREMNNVFHFLKVTFNTNFIKSCASLLLLLPKWDTEMILLFLPKAITSIKTQWALSSIAKYWDLCAYTAISAQTCHRIHWTKLETVFFFFFPHTSTL